MKKIGNAYLLMFIFIFLSFNLEAQKMRIKSSTISFFSAGLLEDIAAVNTASQAILNLVDGAFVLRIPITSFEFPNQLMQEHFNENYLESEKFPVATFKGKLDGAIERIPASNDLFKRGAEKLLSAEYQEIFHSIVAKLLWDMNRARLDLDTAIGFLCTRVDKSDTDD